MSVVAGVDGCRGGWVVALADERGPLDVRVVATFAEILALAERPLVIAIDIPIGLLDAAEAGGRECDRIARGLLRGPRACSVFSPSIRAALGIDDFPAACETSRASSPARIRISLQTFHIRSKVKQVDDEMTPKLQDRVVEVHPELAFFAMNGERPMAHGKKSGEGRRERAALLARGGMLARDGTVPRVDRAAIDDVIDALAACWTARRVLRGEAVRVPERPARDARGLRMEIWR